jgi:hypothetical protein
MKVVNLLLAVMFVIFAFLQINDPDPAIWILIYGAMAVICVLAAFRIYPKKIMIGLLVVYVLYSIVFLPGVGEWLNQDNKEKLFDNVAKMEHIWIEESREFLGLMICVIILIIQLIMARKPARTSSN